MESITVTPTAGESHATVKVNGAAVAGGSTSGAISLNVGANNILVVVTAQSGATKTYTITATRAAPDTSLSDLTVMREAGGAHFGQTLITYGQDMYIYELTPDNSNVTGIYVSVTVNDLGASVEISTGGQPYADPADITLLQPPLDTIITIQVTGKDGATKQTYTITVHPFAGN